MLHLLSFHTTDLKCFPQRSLARYAHGVWIAIVFSLKTNLDRYVDYLRIDITRLRQHGAHSQQLQHSSRHTQDGGKTTRHDAAVSRTAVLGKSA